MKPILLITPVILITLAGCSLSPNQMTTSHSGDSTANMPMNSSSGSMPNTMGSNMHGVTSEFDFVDHMIPHHEEAVTTSKIILARSTNPELRKIATDIIAAQTKEISMMNGWITDWYSGKRGTTVYMPMMRSDLATLNSPELDREYLEGMIAHHAGAIMMANSVMPLTQKTEIVALANDILVSQTKEINMMKKLLETFEGHGHTDDNIHTDTENSHN